MIESIDIEALETPFGTLTVRHFPSGLLIPFSYDKFQWSFTYEHRFTAEVHRIRIDLRKYAVGDSFHVRIGDLNKLESYASDENTIMFAYQDDKNFFALIGKDNDSLYDAEGNLLCGMFFPFLDAPSNEGIDYTIICDPWDERLDDYIAEVWLTWLPLSDQYDAGQLLSELA